MNESILALISSFQSIGTKLRDQISFTGLSDGPQAYNSGQYIKSSHNGIEYISLSGLGEELYTGKHFFRHFSGLHDTPTGYQGHSGDYLVVNDNESGVHFTGIEKIATDLTDYGFGGGDSTIPSYYPDLPDVTENDGKIVASGCDLYHSCNGTWNKIGGESIPAPEETPVCVTNLEEYNQYQEYKQQIFAEHQEQAFGNALNGLPANLIHDVCVIPKIISESQSDGWDSCSTIQAFSYENLNPLTNSNAIPIEIENRGETHWYYEPLTHTVYNGINSWYDAATTPNERVEITDTYFKVTSPSSSIMGIALPEEYEWIPGRTVYMKAHLQGSGGRQQAFIIIDNKYIYMMKAVGIGDSAWAGNDRTYYIDENTEGPYTVRTDNIDRVPLSSIPSGLKFKFIIVFQGSSFTSTLFWDSQAEDAICLNGVSSTTDSDFNAYTKIVESNYKWGIIEGGDTINISGYHEDPNCSFQKWETSNASILGNIQSNPTTALINQDTSITGVFNC